MDIVNAPQFFRKGNYHTNDPENGEIVDFSPDTLFEKLGVEKDPEKLRYYILLDELF